MSRAPGRRRSPAHPCGIDRASSCEPRADSNRRFRLERAASWAAKRRGRGRYQMVACTAVAASSGGELNPQRQGQNLSCCRLHHPRRVPPDERTGPLGASSAVAPRRALPRRVRSRPSRYDRVEEREPAVSRLRPAAYTPVEGCRNLTPERLVTPAACRSRRVYHSHGSTVQRSPRRAPRAIPLDASRLSHDVRCDRATRCRRRRGTPSGRRSAPA